MDDTISVAKLLEYAKQLDEVAVKQIDNLIKKLGLSGESMIHFSDITKRVGETVSKALHTMAPAANDLFTHFSKLSEVGKEVMNVFGDFEKEISGAFKDADIGISDVTIATLQWHGLIDKSITSMGKLGESGIDAGSKISTAFQSISPIFDKAFENSGMQKFCASNKLNKY